MRLVWLVVPMSACSLLTNLDSLHGDAGMPAPGPACQADATFCDDFSEPADASFFPPWTAKHLYGNGQLARTFAGMTCLSASASEGGFANLEKDFIVAATKIHYAFDMQITSYPTAGGNVNTNSIQVPLVPPVGSTVLLSVFLNVTSGMTELAVQQHFVDGGVGNGATVAFTPPSLGVWTHFDMTLDLGMGIASLDIDDGGFDASIQTLLTLPANPSKITAGVDFTGPPVDQFGMLITNTTVWLE